MTPLRLDKNESPVLWTGLAEALERLARDPEPLRRYPDESPLREAWAADAGIEEANVVCTSGGDEAIDLALRLVKRAAEACAERPRALVARPTFSTFEILSPRLGIDLTGPAYAGDGAYPERAMLEAIERERPHAVVLVDPNNPTGTPLPPGLLGRVRAAAGDAALIILDRAYADFAGLRDEDEILARDPNVLIIRSLSKSPGVAGLRIGALLGTKRLIVAASAERMIYSVNAAAVRVGAAALADRAARRRCVALVDEAREIVKRRLERMSVPALHGPTNHALLLLGTRAGDVLAACARRGLVMRDLTTCDIFPGGVRLTIADPDTMERAMDMLEEALAETGWAPAGATARTEAAS